jgi:hypothetical protein
MIGLDIQNTDPTKDIYIKISKTMFVLGIIDASTRNTCHDLNIVKGRNFCGIVKN